MKAAKLLLALGVALVIQTTIARLAGGNIRVDLVLVVVTYLGLTSGPTSGLLAGTIGGLAQDALAGAILGMGGLAKTTAGFLAGVIGTQFIVSQPVPRFFVFFGASIVQSAIVTGLGLLLDMRVAPDIYVTAVTQAVGNALIGTLLFQLVDVTPLLGGGRRKSARGDRYARRI